MFTVIHDLLLNVFVMGIALSWLSKKYPTIAIAVGEIIVLLRTAWQELLNDTNTTAVVNEDPADDQVTDRTSDSLTDDLVSSSSPLDYFWDQRYDFDTAMAIEEAKRNVIRVVDLTTTGEQTVENCIKYFEFLFFDLKLGKDLFAVVHWFLSNKLEWFHFCICDQQLDIVGQLYGALIARGIRLDVPDFWMNPALMVIDNLKNDDVQFSTFANSAYAQLRKDLPSDYSHLIDEMVDNPPKIVRKKKSVGVSFYAEYHNYM